MIATVPILDDLRKLVAGDQRPDYEIAEAAGIHPTTFSTFMSGKRGLSIDSAERLAAVLGYPLRATPAPKRKAK